MPLDPSLTISPTPAPGTGIASGQANATTIDKNAANTAVNRYLSGDPSFAAPEESTILGRYSARKLQAQTSGEAERSGITADYGQQIEDTKTENTRQLTGDRESLKSLGPASLAAVIGLETVNADKRIRTLERNRDIMLANSNTNEAARIDSLIADEQTSITNARKNYLDTVFAGANEARTQAAFETPEQASARTLRYSTQQGIINLSMQAPSAGILPTDDLNSAITKYRASKEYKLNIQKGEADIANVQAQADQNRALATFYGSAFGGTTTSGSTPSRAVNNNPGNITLGPATQQWVSSGKAVVDPTPGPNGEKFLRFTNPQDGLKAMQGLLASSTYSGLTVNSALQKWSNGGYDGSLVPGIANKKISDLTDVEKTALVNRMIKQEGTSTVQATGNISPFNSSNVIDQFAQGLVNGEDPTVMNNFIKSQGTAGLAMSSAIYKRASDLAALQGKVFSPTANSVNTTGQRAYASYENSGSVQAPIKNIDTILGSMQTVLQLADKVNLSKFPKINRAKMLALTETGDPDVKAYMTAALLIGDESAKILGAGGTTDKQFAAATDAFNTDMSPAQLRANLQTMTNFLQRRASSLSKDTSVRTLSSSPSSNSTARTLSNSDVGNLSNNLFAHLLGR